MAVTPDSPGSILIINTHGIGDVIMSIPALLGLRAAWPESRVTAMVKSESEGSLLMAAAASDDFILIDRARLSRWALFRRLLGIRRRSFDMTVSMPGMHPVLAPLLSRWSGARRRVGEQSGRFGKFHNIGLHTRPWQHKVMRHMGLLDALELPGVDSTISLKLPDEDIKMAAGFLSENDIDPSRQTLIGFVPGSGPVEAHKRWATNQFGKMSDLVSAAIPNAVFIVMGSRDERFLAEAIKASAGSARVIDATGRVSLLATAALLRSCRLVVGGDNGLMHLASAIGSENVAVFGPTEPGITGPFWNNRAVFRPNLGCSPCYRRGFIQGCERPICMTTTSADTVALRAIEICLEGAVRDSENDR